MRAGRSILSVSRAAVDRVNFPVRREFAGRDALASDCISQPGSPVSTAQHVKAAYEQTTVGPTQVHSTWCALPQNIELVPQYPYFGFQPNRNHVLIRLPPPLRRMEFSEATPVSRCATERRPCTVWLGSQLRSNMIAPVG